MLRLAAITWDVDPVFFQLGPFSVRWYGILFALALFAGYWVLQREYRLSGDVPEKAERAFLTLLVSVVLGARLGHCLLYEPDKFLPDPLEILKIWHGGLASHGAAVGLVLGTAIVARRLRQPYLLVSDRLCPGLALGSSSVRLGNFINSEIIGRPAHVPWAVHFTNAPEAHLRDVPRHPTQIYEFLIGLAVFGILRAVRHRTRRNESLQGLVTFLYIGLYFLLRFGVEFFKTEQASPDLIAKVTLPMTFGQMFSIPFAIAGWIGVAHVLRKGRGIAKRDEGPARQEASLETMPGKKGGKGRARKRR